MNSINHDVTTGGGRRAPALESVRFWSAAVLPSSRRARAPLRRGGGRRFGMTSDPVLHSGLTSKNGLANSSLLLLLLLALAPMAHAVLPEPGARLYGSIALNGVVVTAANTAVVVEARRTLTGPPIASYQMGSITNAGNFYSLKLQGEDIAPLSDSNNVAMGTTLFLVLRDNSGVRDQKTFTLTGRGLSARVDFGAVDTDADGMSDAFELANFSSATGGSPTADPDLDGRPNLREFLQGTNPNLADGRHPADLTPADDRLTLTEVTDYILAWKTGGTWPVEPALNAANIVDYITRAGALWKGGETYVFDNTPPTNAPMWWLNVGTPSLAGAGEGGNRGRTLLAERAALRVERGLPMNYRPNQAVAVTVDTAPAESTRAYALVESPPAGWVVRNVSHEGRWDAVNKQIKWGPYFDQTPRRFTYDAVPGPDAKGMVDFAGRGSFDGYGFSPAGVAKAYPVGQGPAARLLAVLTPAGLRVELTGEAGRKYVLETTENLVSWTSGPTVTTDAEGKAMTTTAVGAGARFFRLKPVE